MYIENLDDVWNYIDLLKKESDEIIKEGSSFTTLNNIYEQLPFFCCVNSILNEKSQEDISMYVYCNETNTPAFNSSYQNTPALWIQKYYIIKEALSIREKKIIEKQKNVK